MDYLSIILSLYNCISFYLSICVVKWMNELIRHGAVFISCTFVYRRGIWIWMNFILMVIWDNSSFLWEWNAKLRSSLFSAFPLGGGSPCTEKRYTFSTKIHNFLRFLSSCCVQRCFAFWWGYRFKFSSPLHVKRKILLLVSSIYLFFTQVGAVPMIWTDNNDNKRNKEDANKI